MARLNWQAMIVSLLAHGIVSSAAADNHPCQGFSHDPPREPREGSVRNDYSGTVTEVTKDSITIRWVNSPGEKPKKFGVSETLAAGKVPMELRRIPGARREYQVEPEFMYRLTDVKVGDCVTIDYARVNGVDICDHIWIRRRPDGLVPPLPKEAEDLRDDNRKLRERYRTELPNKPLPAWLARRPVPYHEWVNAYWARQAPMPRAVKPHGPAISP